MPDLRPLDFGETLDASLVIYRRHFGLFLKLAVITLAAPVVLLVYFGLRFFTDVGQNPLRLLFIVPVGLLYYVASLVLTAGTIRIIADSYLGRPPTLRDALSLGMSKIWPLIAVGLGKGIVLALIMIGTGVVAAVAIPLTRSVGAVGVMVAIALVGGGIWFAIYVACGYGVTTPVVVLEDLTSSFDAFGRSWDLTRGFKLKVLGLSVVAFLVCNLIPSQVFQAVATAVMPTAPAVGVGLAVCSVVLPLILAPVIASVITLMYYDLRVRREAFDLQVLGQQLGMI
ncbi:MAG TPA: hypothetical protein VFU41_00100 [Gemmatimonadales bacterium]|nr:hypothetical protein [Gemmatimonadales bacterium]